MSIACHKHHRRVIFTGKTISHRTGDNSPCDSDTFQTGIVKLDRFDLIERARKRERLRQSRSWKDVGGFTYHESDVIPGLLSFPSDSLPPDFDCWTDEYQHRFLTTNGTLPFKSN